MLQVSLLTLTGTPTGSGAYANSGNMFFPMQDRLLYVVHEVHHSTDTFLIHVAVHRLFPDDVYVVAPVSIFHNINDAEVSPQLTLNERANTSIIDFPSLGITYNGGWCSATKTR